MSIYSKSDSVVQILVCFYEYIDKLSSIEKLPGVFKNNKLSVYVNDSLNIFILRENKSLYLISEKGYKELLPFKIKLGSTKNPFNKRVKNELKSKLFKITGSFTKKEIDEIVNDCIEEKLIILFNTIKNRLTKNIFTILFTRTLNDTIFNHSKEFCIKQNINAQVSVERSLFGNYKVRICGVHYPSTILSREFSLVASGNENTIKLELIKAIRDELKSSS